MVRVGEGLIRVLTSVVVVVDVLTMVGALRAIVRELAVLRLIPSDDVRNSGVGGGDGHSNGGVGGA